MHETYKRALGETPYQREIKRAANKAIGWEFEPVLAPLGQRHKEYLASWAKLRGPERDDPKLLGNALRDYLEKDMR